MKKTSQNTKKSTPARDVDGYLATLPKKTSIVLEKLRKAIKAAAPLAEEVISYQIPTYKYHGPLVHFIAHKDYCSFIVTSKTVLKTFASELESFDTSGTTIHFTVEHSLPATLVKKIVKARIAENELRARDKQGTNCRYVAFLRGINVGGNVLVKMDDLKKTLEKFGLGNVRTILASGNVTFESKQADIKTLAAKIHSELRKTFKKDIGLILRSIDDINRLQASEPFKGIKVTPSIRLYVTFLAGEAGPLSIKIPYATPKGEFRILQATPTEVFSLLDLSKGKGTPDAMKILEKEFGSNVTTRNWNTIQKILMGR